MNSKCITCTKSANVQEEGNQTKVFCNEICQKIHYVNIGADIDGLFDLQEMPKELILFIANNLDIKTLVSLCNTNKNLRHLICENEVFKINYINNHLNEFTVYFRNAFVNYEREMVNKWIDAALKSNWDPSGHFNDAIIHASMYGYLNIVRLLLRDPRVDPSARTNDAIISASQFGHVEVVRLLLTDDRVDPSDNENRAIIDASQFGHLEIVRLLLQDSRVNPSDKFNAAIRNARYHHNTEIVRLLQQDPRYHE